MNENRKLDELQATIGYTFRDRKLLTTALTHSSYANENNSGSFNERLEFLGDSVLGFLSAEYFFKKLPRRPEGELTRIRAKYVCESALYDFARQIDLGRYLRLGHGEDMGGGRDRPSILSDAFEALVAAIYLDGGIDRARDFVLSFIGVVEVEDREFTDYKTALQEIVQRNPDELLSYALVSESGPAHARVFEVEVLLNSNRIAVGTGTSKKRAEQQAAKAALELMGIRDEAY